jgi:hypothetical protein
VSYEREREIREQFGEVRTTSATGGQKGTKLERYDLIPTEALYYLARHYGVGAQKYDDDNWRKGYEWSKSYAALQRHLHAFWGGEDLDLETGSPHLTAAAWHCFTLLVFMLDEQYADYDDRIQTGTQGQMTLPFGGPLG